MGGTPVEGVVSDASLRAGARVKFYRAAPLNTIPAGQGDPAELGGAVIAIRLADLVSPAARRRRPAAPRWWWPAPADPDRGAAGVREGGRGRAGGGPPRRQGQAGGYPADHARLGALEQQLDQLAGPGVIDEIAAQATLEGKVKGKARRSMTAASAIRATILMALMPDTDYAGVLAAVFGDLVLVPWQRPFRVPTPKVLGTWRAALGPAPLARLQARLLAAAGASTATTTTGPSTSASCAWARSTGP